jgi:hypothetical protein
MSHKAEERYYKQGKYGAYCIMCRELSIERVPYGKFTIEEFNRVKTLKKGVNKTLYGKYLQKDATEFIICAAIWYKELPLKYEEPLRLRGFSPYNVDCGVVMCGWRHMNCMYQMVGITGLRDCEAGESIQGFLTNKNRFVDRKEGGEIAYGAGQTKGLKARLYSEDLY